MQKSFAVLIFLTLVQVGIAHASSQCTAVGKSSTCTVSCPLGQTATCRPESNGSQASCDCEGKPSLGASRSAERSKQFLNGKQLVQTNLTALVNQKLSNLRNYEISQSCRWVEDGYTYEPCGSGERGGRCRTPSYRQACDPIFGKLSLAGGVNTLRNVTAKVDPVDYDGMPKEFFGWRSGYANCSPVEQTETYSFTTKQVTGQKVSKSETLLMGNEFSVRLEWAAKTGLGGGIGGKFTRNVTITNAAEETSQQEQTISYTAPYKVTSNTFMTVTHTWIRRTVTIPFSGTAEADGPIAPNREGITAASQVLGNVADRTFNFSGDITEVEIFDGQTIVLASSLTSDECKAMAAKPPLSEFVSGVVK